MDNMDVQYSLEKIENEKESLFRLDTLELKENNNRIYNLDLDDEFDVIRSIN